MMGLELTGDWARATRALNNLATRINPEYTAQMSEDGELILEKLKGHIYSQDLGWTPLSQHTIELKGGDSTIMIETGKLVNGLTVKKISSSDGVSFFIGADDSSHHEGVSMSDLLIWLEYGTDKMPPRPLIRPTYEEVKSLLQKNWVSILKNIIES